MSLVVITHHDENIFNINKNEEQFPKKKDEGKNEREPLKRGLHLTKRYMDLIKKSECKQPNSTMGPPFIEPPDPANFLKKGTGNQTKPICLNLEKRVPLVQKKPPIPPVLPKSKPKKHVNFVSKNIQNVKMMKSKEPNLRVVVHPLGDVKPLRYFKKGKEFAQVPHYLVKLKSHVEEKRLREKEAVSIKQPLCTYITSDQREALLQGLKTNWEELQIAYQGLPILTDTIPKINRKVKLESALKQLENDIILVEKHPYIYVYNNEEEDT